MEVGEGEATGGLLAFRSSLSMVSHQWEHQHPTKGVPMSAECVYCEAERDLRCSFISGLKLGLTSLRWCQQAVSSSEGKEL